MGQKCSCFDKEIEKKFEQMQMSGNTYEHNNTEYVIAKKQKIRNSSKIMNDDDINEKIQIIVKNISYWFLKKKFKEAQKKTLTEISENLFKELISSENVKKLMEINKQIKNSFETNGWKKYYNEFPLTFEDLPIKKNELNFIDLNIKLNQIIINNKLEDLFGNTQFKNLIYIMPQKNKDEKNMTKKNSDNDLMKNKNSSYIYTGNINKFGEKHGSGVLYYLDGSSMEIGTWFNNHLIGWCRKIFPSGIYIECN